MLKSTPAALASILLACSGPAQAWESPAPDVVIYCTPGLLPPVAAIGKRFEHQTGIPVHFFVSPPAGLSGLIVHRARADVLVADGGTVGALAQSGALRAASVVQLGQDPFVLAGRAGGAGAAPFDQALAHHRVAVPDATSAASFDGAALLRVAAPSFDAGSIIGVADTPDVAAEIRSDASVVGVLEATAAHQPGLAALATLPVPAEPVAAALVTNGQSHNAAALLAAFATPEGRAVLQAYGMEARP